MKLRFIPEKKIEVDKKYFVKTAGSLALMADFYEYSEDYELDIQLKSIEGNLTNLVIKPKLINRLKTNDSFNYSFALLDLIKKIVLKVNASGKLEEVSNAHDFEYEWIERRNYYRSKHRNEDAIDESLKMVDSILSDQKKLMSFISQNSPFSLLFYPIYNENQPLKNHIILNDFLIEFDLPVIKEIKKNEQSELSLEAKIDNSIFNKRPFAKYLKEKTDIYNLKVLLELDYEEKYEYAKDGIIISAEHYFATGVSGCFSNTIARTLTEITK